MKRIAAALLILVLLLPLWAGLADAETVNVMVTFYPVYILAENLLCGVENVTLSSMTPPSTGCLHDYQLLTGDMRALSRAQALLINGAGMESFLPRIESQYPDLVIVDCPRSVALLAEEEEDDEEEEEHHNHNHGHDHGELNAHIWLDPKNAVQMVENMRAALTALIPAGAEQINENAAAYTARLTALDEELSAAIAAMPNKRIVTFHEAFPYFAAAYGLEVAAVVAIEPDEPLSPRMLAQAAERVRAAGNPPLFAEPQYEGAALRVIAQETGAPVYELDPLVTGDGALTAYEDVMRKNLAVLRDALGDEQPR